MRSINNTVQHLKVEGHETLSRDVSSHAIINNDDEAYRAYVTRRHQEKRQREELSKVKSEVEELKSDIKEIKNLLTLLVKGNV